MGNIKLTVQKVNYLVTYIMRSYSFTLFSSFFIFVKPFNKIPPEQLYPGPLFDSPETSTCAKSLFYNNNDKGCDTTDPKIREAVTDYLCRYSSGDVLYNFRRKQRPKSGITLCYCCGFIFKYIEQGEVCTAYCDYSGEGEKITGKESLVNLPFNWGDECPQAKLDGDGNELPLGPCRQVSPPLKTSTIKPPSTTTPRSIQTTKQVKKLATTERTTTSKKWKSPTTASPKFSEQLIIASTTTQKNKTTRRREIFRNQRLTTKRPREAPFSDAVLVTQPSVVTSTSTSTTTAMKTKLATTSSSKLNNSNVKKAATLLKPKVETKRDDIIIWQK